MNEPKKKEKPAYSVWQNTRYMTAHAWRWDKGVLFIIAAQIFLAVAIATVAIFLPATVVEQITRGVDLQRLVLTILGFTAVTVVLNGINGYYEMADQGRTGGLRLRFANFIMERVVTTDYANLDEQKFNDLRQKASDQVFGGDMSTQTFYETLKDLGIGLLGFIVYMVILINVHPLVLSIAAVSCIFGAIARQRANKWWHDHDSERAAPSKRGSYINGINERNSMMKDIRLFAMVDWIKALYTANMNLVYAFQRRGETKNLLADLVDCIAIFLREGVAYAYLIYLVLNGQITVDMFVLLFAAVGGFSGWVTEIFNQYVHLSRHSLNICRVRECIEYPNKFTREGGAEIPKADLYALEFRNVTYRYHGTEENVLENLNLTITAGEKLAIVGLNGAGKTTMVKLMCGLYDPTEGTVLLNGTDIRTFNREEYYSLFTAVFQEFNILPYSIRNNITPDTGEGTEKRLQESLSLAGVADKINALPQGADTKLIKEVHFDAAELSGGETQRLMLARALYKNAPILILDEPSAALDPIAESELYERYNALSRGRTSVYISHRLASTRFCDRILLIDGKGIAETGTHDELIRAGKKYAELFEIQSKYYRKGVEVA
ncbi:MAG: ABC transporter ATP-binding protein/permease [Defluviitaleaceae bacterium]|nr:ABC transporter ATP-binding protein/permease [Defluviitaleaceae bacterium]MCL2275725.1 ABC transporter ATP-binding protein/permease [Defluviitaleaceae bacterium]